jgi:hypothetical protein
VKPLSEDCWVGSGDGIAGASGVGALTGGAVVAGFAFFFGLAFFAIRFAFFFAPFLALRFFAKLLHRLIVEVLAVIKFR